MRPQQITLLLILFVSQLHCANLSAPQDIYEEIDNPTIDESSLETNPLTIVSINVGQGDATLIVTPSGKTILIDGGPPESGQSSILPLFNQLGISKLDHLYVSHYDSDHIGGIAEVIRGKDNKINTMDDFAPEITYDRGPPATPKGDIYEEYLELTSKSSELLAPGRIIIYDHLIHDHLTIECLIINGRTDQMNESIFKIEENDENSRSMGLLIQYGDFKYFTGGDLPGGGLDSLPLESEVAHLVGAVDILHVNHHGSESSSSTQFLEILKPTVSIISTGNNNSHNHPSPTVIDRLYQIGSTIYQTERGAGSQHPDVKVDDSIFISVYEDGRYKVQQDEYKIKP